jgi:hypothetical protein
MLQSITTKSVADVKEKQMRLRSHGKLTPVLIII